MKVSQLLTGFLSFILLSSLSCKKEVVGTGHDYSDNSENYVVEINECEKVSEGVQICYKSLISDSRCPEDVVCVWSGEAIIRVTFKIDENVYTFNMTSLPKNITSIPGFNPAIHDTTIHDYQITFIDLLPRPKVHPSENYKPDTKAIFRISK